jgi:hypothetical protein
MNAGETKHLMPDAGGALRPLEATERIVVPIRRGEQMGSLTMTARDARELRDWLAAHVPDEAFGGE